MIILRLIAVSLVTVMLSACSATITPATVDSTMKIASTTSPVVKISGPYDFAKACIARIPGVNKLDIAVGEITDETNKISVAEGGTGGFLPKEMTATFFNSLYDLGVSVTDFSKEQREDVVFAISVGVRGKLRTPSFVIRGSLSSLDFGQKTKVAEAAIFGFGPRARVYNATGSMDLRMVSLPGGKHPANEMVAKSSPFKQFMAVESEAGLASFFGTGTGLFFGSFRIGSSVREPMQHTARFLADYAVSELVLEYLSKYGSDAQKASVPACLKLLNWSPRPVQTATAT